MQSKPSAVRVLILGLSFAFSIPLAQASTPIRESIRKGLEALGASDLQTAQSFFERAYRSAPENPEAAYFFAVGCNRRGRGDEALRYFRRARAKGYQHPRFDFEWGWANLQARQYAEAEASLGRALRTKPNDLTALEFRGRALFGQRKLSQAKQILRQVLKRDPNRADTVHPYLAKIADLEGDVKARQTYLSAFEHSKIDSPIAAAYRSLRGTKTARTESKTKNRRVQGFGCLGYGRTNNVIALPDSTPLPTELSSRSAGSWQSGLGVQFQFDPESTRHRTLAGLQYQRVDYQGDASVVDRESALAYGFWQNRIAPKKFLGLFLSQSVSMLRSDTVRSRLALKPSYLRQLSDRSSLEAAYEFALDDFRFPSTAASDRDGNQHGFSLTYRSQLSDTRWNFFGSLYRGVFEADGSDFDRDSRSVTLGLTRDLRGGAKASVQLTRGEDKYDNLNSFSGFAQVREDDLDLAQFEFSWPVRSPWTAQETRAYLRGIRSEVESNVSVFRYDQTSFVVGVSTRF